MLQIASAVTYTVGDAVGWTFVESATFYDDWAKTHTFRVGDELGKLSQLPLNLLLKTAHLALQQESKRLLRLTDLNMVPLQCCSSK